MAKKVFPEALPSSVRADSKRRAEVTIYEALAAQLSDPWVVFYSVPWIGRERPASRRADGEADFVVAHPDLGFIAIEVKGGGIKVARDGWASTDRAGSTHQIKDPFQQALRSKHVLQDKILRSRAWRGVGMLGSRCDLP
ncbi:MAG: NERD domain-containing protein [bacterium]